MQLIASELIKFYRSLRIGAELPAGIDLLHPHASEEVMQVVAIFFNRYYADDYPRQLLFGINPGRFGAGTTGINFTAPKQLKDFCGIDHPFKSQSELSAEFIYDLIMAYGGPVK